MAKTNVHWTHAEDLLVAHMREEDRTWAEISVAVAALGTPRSPQTCAQRTIYLRKTRPKGTLDLRSLPGEGTEVTLGFVGGNRIVQTQRTLVEIIAFLEGAG